MYLLFLFLFFFLSSSFMFSGSDFLFSQFTLCFPFVFSNLCDSLECLSFLVKNEHFMHFIRCLIFIFMQLIFICTNSRQAVFLYEFVLILTVMRPSTICPRRYPLYEIVDFWLPVIFRDPRLTTLPQIKPLVTE